MYLRDLVSRLGDAEGGPGDILRRPSSVLGGPMVLEAHRATEDLATLAAPVLSCASFLAHFTPRGYWFLRGGALHRFS